jgi:hypothetical protein
MLQVGATGIEEEEEEDINSVHTEKIGPFSDVTKLVLPLMAFLLVPHRYLAKGL